MIINTISVSLFDIFEYKKIERKDDVDNRNKQQQR